MTSRPAIRKRIVPDGAKAVPDEMCAWLEYVCGLQGVTPSELALELLSDYLEAERQKRWAELFEYGQQRARELGIKPEDVERLVEECRAETSSSQK